MGEYYLKFGEETKEDICPNYLYLFLGICMSITQSQGDKMTILRNSMLLRYTAAMALFSIAINTACANSGQVGIAPVSTTTLKKVFFLLSIAIRQLASRPHN